MLVGCCNLFRSFLPLVHALVKLVCQVVINAISLLVVLGVQQAINAVEILVEFFFSDLSTSISFLLHTLIVALSKCLRLFNIAISSEFSRILNDISIHHFKVGIFILFFFLITDLHALCNHTYNLCASHVNVLNYSLKRQTFKCFKVEINHLSQFTNWFQCILKCE